LADHYILVDELRNDRAIPFAECPVCAAIEWRFDQLDGDEVVMVGLIGVLGCEVVALNEILTRLRPHVPVTESTFERIELAAPRMGLLTRVMIRMGQ
jgi:hypothetical protein